VKVEIWSDVMCPFCYIGKKQFENALSHFEGHNNVEIIWRSFELNPTIQYSEGYSLTDYLSEIKGMEKEAVIQNFEEDSILAEIAKNCDLHFTNFAEISESQELDQAVNSDVYMAQQVGARGVPFFVFDDAYAISGAHGADTFLNVLKTVELKSGK
jgi:predicted DsbA family dithiol-disulfide isomerase